MKEAELESSGMRIDLARSDSEIERCYSVMAELRPHVNRDAFLGRVRGQERQGYRLAFLEEGGEVKAVAGFRVSECLAWGRFLYVDDLVTAARNRSQGHGRRLLDWLVERAVEERCDEIHLDSGVQRSGAHRFYSSRRFTITSHHFARKLRED